jgi:TRAP-type C4-dicarboxylate transport system permease small subunit
MPDQRRPATSRAAQTDDPEGDESGQRGLGGTGNPELLPPREPFRSLFRWLGRAEQGISVVLLLVILVLVLLQIIQRFLPSGFAWTGEIARFAMVWITFLMAGNLLARDAHIAIKVVDYFLPVRTLGVVKLLGHVLITVVCVVMMYGVVDFVANDRGQVTVAAQVPFAIIYSVVAFGFASTAVRGILAVLLIDLPEIRRGEKVLV